MIAFMGSYGYAFAVISPVLVPLTQAFNVSIPTAALISTAMFGGAAVMSIPSGLLADSWGVRRAVILGQVLLVVGWVITYFSSSFPAILVGRVVIGCGGMTMGVSGAAALVQWFKPRALALPMGIWSAAFPIGIAWGEPLAGEAVASMGWRGVFLTGAILSVVCLIVAVLVVKPGPLRHGGPATAAATAEPRAGSVFKNLEVWKFNFALLLSFIAFMSVTTYWVAWLMLSKGITSVVTASTITGFLGIAGIFGAPAAGFIATKLKKSKPVFVIPSIIFGLGLLAFIFAQGVAQLIALSVVVGAASNMLVTMTFAIPPQLVSRQFAGTAIGIAVTFWNLAGIIGPLVVGVAYSSSGALTLPMLLMFVGLIVAAILTQVMKIR
jgi:predicted MFS family arabinose efflux permease